MHLTRPAAALLALALSHPACALVLAPSIEVDLVSPPALHVAPGESATLAFTVRNITDGALDAARAEGFMPTSEEALAGYTFVPLTPACAAPYLAAAHRFTFDLSATIAPGESIHCSYRVERAAHARHDISFHLCGAATQGFCERTVRIGTLPEMRIHVEQASLVPVGARTALVRIRVENLSAWTIPRRDVTTACNEFAGGQSPPGPFLVRTDFEGACQTGESIACPNLGGQSYFSYGFAFGPFAPGESRSCLLRLDFHEPAADHLRTPLFFTDILVTSDDGAIGVGLAGEQQFLGITLSPGSSAPVRIPLGRAGLALLVLVLLGSAAWLLHRADALPHGRQGAPRR